jgi:hypothetical protein
VSGICGGCWSEKMFPGDVKFHSLPKYKEVKKEDKTYVKVVSAKTKITPGLIVFQVGNNLFSGDNVIGDDIIRVMNENWNVFLILTLKEIIRRL